MATHPITEKHLDSLGFEKRHPNYLTFDKTIKEDNDTAITLTICLQNTTPSLIMNIDQYDWGEMKQNNTWALVEHEITNEGVSQATNKIKELFT